MAPGGGRRATVRAMDAAHGRQDASECTTTYATDGTKSTAASTTMRTRPLPREWAGGSCRRACACARQPPDSGGPERPMYRSDSEPGGSMPGARVSERRVARRCGSCRGVAAGLAATRSWCWILARWSPSRRMGATSAAGRGEVMPACSSSFRRRGSTMVPTSAGSGGGCRRRRGAVRGSIRAGAADGRRWLAHRYGGHLSRGAHRGDPEGHAVRRSQAR